MNYTDITNWLADAIPLRRKSSLDWILPASIGLGVGVAAGIGVGMLLAPTRGDELRRKLRDGAVRIKDKALYKAGEVKGHLTTKANELERSFVEESNRGYGRDIGKVG